MWKKRENTREKKNWKKQQKKYVDRQQTKWQKNRAKVLHSQVVYLKAGA